MDEQPVAINEPDTFNHFFVGVQAEKIRILNPKVLGSLTGQEALNLAAWLVVMAEMLVDPKERDFDALVEAIRNT